MIPAGVYEFVMDIYSDIPLTHQDKVSFTLNVFTFYNIEMEIKETSKDANIGDNVSFTAMLNNTGNIRATYNWGVESDQASWIWLGDPTFTVDFGDTYQLLFNVRVPMNAPVDTYDFLFTLFSEGYGNTSFEQSFKVNVTETLDFSLSVLNDTYNAVMGGEILLPLRVANVGNAALPLTFRIFGEPWGILEHRNLFVIIEEVEELIISFNPPWGIEQKEYSFLIIGELITGIALEKIITVKINVENPFPTNEYFEILFSGEAYELQIEGEIVKSAVVPSGNLNDNQNSWPSLPDDVFWERFILSGTSQLDMSVRLNDEGFIDDISNEKYSLIIMKVHGEDRARIVLEDMSFEADLEQHKSIIEWPHLDKSYSMLFTRFFQEKSYQISASDMVMTRNQSDNYIIRFHDKEYDFAVTKMEPDGNSMTVVMKDIPLGDSDRTEFEIDWTKVVKDESDAVILSYRDLGGNVLSTFSLSPVSTGRDLVEKDDALFSMQILSLIIGIFILVILLGTGVVIKGKTIRDKNMLTKYSVLGIVSMNENGVTFEDLIERMGLIKNGMKLDEKIIMRNFEILIANDHIYTKSIRDIPHYYAKDNEFSILGMN